MGGLIASSLTFETVGLGLLLTSTDDFLTWAGLSRDLGSTSRGARTIFVIPAAGLSGRFDSIFDPLLAGTVVLLFVGDSFGLTETFLGVFLPLNFSLGSMSLMLCDSLEGWSVAVLFSLSLLFPSREAPRLPECKERFRSDVGEVASPFP